MSFDRLAPHYRWMECVLAGGKLQRCRTAWLPEVRDARRVLLAGEGNGRFLEALLGVNATADIVCVDASRRMLERAQRRLGRLNNRVRFIQADLRDWSDGQAGFDLVVTNFFLDCFPAEQLREVATTLASVAASRSRWLVADFCRPAGGLRRARAEAILWLMYRFFRVATRLPATRLVEPDSALNELGFVLRARRGSEWGLLRSDLWERGA